MQKEKWLSYKTYKDMLWSKKVYRVGAVTKKVPRKYRVGRKWYLTGMLLKTRPTDEISEAIIESRDTKAEKKRQDEIQQDLVNIRIRMKREKQKAKWKAKKMGLPEDSLLRKRDAYSGARKKMFKMKMDEE